MALVSSAAFMPERSLTRCAGGRAGREGEVDADEGNDRDSEGEDECTTAGDGRNPFSTVNRTCEEDGGSDRCCCGGGFELLLDVGDGVGGCRCGGLGAYMCSSYDVLSCGVFCLCMCSSWPVLGAIRSSESSAWLRLGLFSRVVSILSPSGTSCMPLQEELASLGSVLDGTCGCAMMIRGDAVSQASCCSVVTVVSALVGQVARRGWSPMFTLLRFDLRQFVSRT